MIVYYDVTRLISRHSAPTPTGIDRVDIHYANYFLNNSEKIRFIYQNKGVFFILSKTLAKQLVFDLFDRWIQCGHYENTLSKLYRLSVGNEKAIKVKSDLIRFTRYLHGKLKGDEPVDGILIDKLIKDSSEDSVSYINVSHHGVGNIKAYYVFRTVAKARIIFYLHDIIPIDYPEYVRPGDDENHKKRVRAMAEYGDLVLVNSAYTKERFISFCNEEGLVYNKIEEAIIGVEKTFLQLSEEFNDAGSENQGLIDGEYFVYVSTVEPRKNHMLLLEAWRSMVSNGLDVPKLVILGKRGWNVEHVNDFLDRSPLLENKVVELSGVTDRQMVAIVKNSLGLLFPSFVEGWGMPLVEAISLNVPVVCSDISAFHQSGQNICVYLDPLDSLGWQKEVLNIYQNKEYAKTLISKYQEFKMPSWEVHFDKLKIDLESIVNLKVKSFVKPKSKKQLKELFAKSNNSRYKALKDIYTERSGGMLVAKGESKLNRKINKFKRDPVSFFNDSKFFLFRYIGRKLGGV
ncbi:MAG: glycosyltransferase family 1 protein [Colwellia sp.]